MDYWNFTNLLKKRNFRIYSFDNNIFYSQKAEKEETRMVQKLLKSKKTLWLYILILLCFICVPKWKSRIR
jgi:hypothetical protein